MNKNFTILIAVLFISFASLAHETDFNDLSMWSAEEFYRRGDVVRLQDDMYISVIPSRGRPLRRARRIGARSTTTIAGRSGSSRCIRSALS